MARTYSAIMALIGLVVVLLRGMKNSSGFDGTIVSGLAWMALLGAIGLVIGIIAAQTVDESVRTKIEAELASLPGAENPGAKNTAGNTAGSAPVA